MGHKKIWDGKDLPEKGDLVLIHLSRSKAYVPHTVDAFRVSRVESGDYRIHVDLLGSHDPRSSKNTRSLQDCFALDTDPLDLPVDGCLKTPREAQAAKAGAK